MAWTAPASFSTAEVVTASKLNIHLRDNLNSLWYELAYVEFTADVSVTTASTEASPSTIVETGSAYTFNTVPTLFEFYAGYNNNANSGGTLGFSLWLAGVPVDLGRLGVINYSGTGPMFVARRLTPPSTNNHNYQVRAWATVNTQTVTAGAGGVGTKLPGYLRVLQRGSA